MINMYAHTNASAGGSALAESLGIKKIRHENSRYRGKEDKIVINWGSTELPLEVSKSKVINTPESVVAASNKLEFFNHLSMTDVSIPEFTTSEEQARQWLQEGKTLVARTLLRASSGRGIVMIEDLDAFVRAPLYTVYVPKKEEYRVHVVNGSSIDIQRKARNTDIPDEEVNWKVRTHGNGFVFARQGVQPPASVVTEAIKAVEALGLHFGAADVIWNEKRQMAYVLEVNTAPGLEGTTLERYSEAFKRELF